MKKKNFLLFFLDNLIWFIDIGLIIAFVSIQPTLIMPKNLISMIYSVSMLGFLVLAQAIVLISGNFDLSVGAIAGFSSVIAALTFERWIPGLPAPLLILIMLFVGVVIGFYNGFFIVKLNINPFLQTLGTNILFYGLMLILGGGTLFTIPSGIITPGGGMVGKSFVPIAVPFLIIVAILVHYLLSLTPLGRRIYAVGSNKEASRACGINVEKTIMSVFILSGLLSSIGGLIYTGYMSCVTMDMAQNDLFSSFAGAIIGGVALTGGRGKISGVFGGILLLGILEIGLTILRVPATWRQAMNGLVLVAAILINTYQAKWKGIVLAR
jgi:ribose/xylose/arabinose/galactoside ABC-type transport system permease subunit